jgi:hypothetical protein
MPFFIKKPIFYIFLLIIIIAILAITLLNFSSTSNISLSSTNPHPGSCLILEEKYCRTVKFVKNPLTDTGQFAIYKVNNNTIIFSPLDGVYAGDTKTTVSKDDSSQKYPEIFIFKYKDSLNSIPDFNLSFIFYNNLPYLTPDTLIKKGQIIGKIANKNINYFGNYNLAVKSSKYIDKNTPYKSIPANDILMQILNPK